MARMPITRTFSDEIAALKSAKYPKTVSTAWLFGTNCLNRNFLTSGTYWFDTANEASRPKPNAIMGTSESSEA